MPSAMLAHLSDHLARALPALGTLREARRFTGGQSNPTWLVEATSGRFVLRQKPPGLVLPSAHAIDREFRLLKALAPTAVPVPGPLLYCDDPSVIGAEFYLMAHVDGVVHWNAVLPDQPAALRAPITLAMVDVLAALHGVDWRARRAWAIPAVPVIMPPARSPAGPGSSAPPRTGGFRRCTP